jgi:hypothetical protein
MPQGHADVFRHDICTQFLVLPALELLNYWFQQQGLLGYSTGRYSVPATVSTSIAAKTQLPYYCPMC